MQKTLPKKQRGLLTRTLSLLAMFSMAFVSVPALNSEVAVADQFTSETGPPQLGSIALSKESSGAFESFQPGWPRSTEIYTASVTVTKPGGLVQLSNGLTLCLWQSSADDCNDAEPNPQTTFVVEWEWDFTTSSDSVRVVGTNEYSADATRSDYSSAAAERGDAAATVDFIFQVSHAMRHSFDWNLQITADDGSKTATELISNLRTSYFGQIRTARNPMTFLVEESSSAVRENVSLGDYAANSESEITIQASNFTREIQGSNVVLPLSRSNVPSNLLSMECSPTNTFEPASSKMLDNSPREFTSVTLLTSSQPETPTSIGNHSCRLNYRANILNPNMTYTNTVTVGIAAGDYNKPLNLQETAKSTTSASIAWDEPEIVGLNGNGVTLDSYVVEISGDTGRWEFATRTTSRTYTAGSLAERQSYDFRVTANTSVGAGSSTLSVATNGASGASLQTLQALNSSLTGFTETSDATDVIAAIEAEGLTVFAAPTYGNMAERMYEENSGGSSLDRKGYFREDLFENPTELARLGGFSGNLDNAPFIGFVGFGNNTFHGSAIMGFTSDADGAITNTAGSEDTVYLSDLFRNDTTAKTFGTYVLNANGTSVDNSSTDSKTIWSDGLSYRTNQTLCELYNKFACDDIVLGFTAGSTSTLDGNGGSYLRNDSNSSYGVENDNGGDYQTSYYWGQSYTDTDYVFYFFISEAS